MHYYIGTTAECTPLIDRLPENVIGEIVRGVAILEEEFGKDRDYYKEGGFSIVVETTEDLAITRSIFDDRVYPCEWATELGRSGFCSALYLIEDLAIMLYSPTSIVNDNILENLEKEP